MKREPGKGGGSSTAKGGSLLSPFMRALAAKTPVLEGLYHYPKSQEGVHHEPWIRLFGAVLEPAPDGFVGTDNQATGGASLWTFAVRLLGVKSLGWRALDESATWKSIGIRVTKLRKQQQQQPEGAAPAG